MKAFAKINWCLLITGKKDGYHLLDTIMEEIDLYDEVSVSIGQEETSVLSGIPGDICYRACQLFYEATGIADGAKVEVQKNIPMQAGLGGGSADACCVLKSLQEQYGNPLTLEQLFAVAQKLGADVPFFLHGGRQRARSKGELLTPLSKSRGYHLVVAKPKGGISTGKAFALYDYNPVLPKINVGELEFALEKGDLELIAKNMKNCLEGVSTGLLPQIDEIKQILLSMGAKAAMMTGSGAAVIGLFEKEQTDLSPLQEYFAVSTRTI